MTREEEIINKARELQQLICGKKYDCDAAWCPLEVVYGALDSKGNRCHLQRLVDTIENETRSDYSDLLFLLIIV